MLKNIKKILRENLMQLSEIDWESDFNDVGKTCVNGKDLVDYLNKVRANAFVDYKDRENFNKNNNPFVHAKSDIFKKTDTEIDVDYFIKTITSRPKTLINSTEKIGRSGGINEFVYKTGIPAIKGIVYDIENKQFYYINTCPNAGQCKAICYALKGRYLQYPAAYDSMTKRLNMLLNHPAAYEEQLVNELIAKAKEHKALEGYKNKIILRWNDSGDFFGKKYLEIAERVIDKVKKAGYNIDSYAYTKMGSVVNNNNLGSVSYSSGGKKELGTDANKKALVIPKNLFKDLDFMKLSDEQELKKRVSNYFKLDPSTVLTYDEMMTTKKSDKPIWNVIVTPHDGDDAGFRHDVKNILLTQH